ncbi:MAG: hypothetical protein JWQ49_4067 [Edaphobacter sp.]|nr:hypothetical protein [Edaphobacter sp.]
MSVTFSNIKVGHFYSRNTLAALWGYSSYHALARGVVTPKTDDKIVLFVTENKQESAEQYVDQLNGDVLHWEGPKDHFAEERMLKAAQSGEEIHLFHRNRHHSDFTYLGKIAVEKHRIIIGSPSKFVFRVRQI